MTDRKLTETPELAPSEAREAADLPVERDPGGRTYTIPEWNLPGLESKIAKLAKRAEKLGVPAPTLERVGSETRYHVENDYLLWEVDGHYSGWVDESAAKTYRAQAREHGHMTIDLTGRVAQFYTVKVHGEFPKYAGWSLRAVIDRDLEEPDQPNVVHTVGDGGADPEWRNLGDYCDHCKAKDGRAVPRGRKKLVVVEHGNGYDDVVGADDTERKVVGLTCLRDFLGGTTPDTLASWAEVIGGLDDLVGSYEDYEGGGGGAGVETRFRPEDVLALTSAEIRAHGWVSRAKARDEVYGVEATADQVWNHLQPLRHGRDERPMLTGDDEKSAEGALNWALEIPLDTDNDYLANVRAVAGKQGWRFRDMGIGASILAAYQRERARVIETKDRKANAKPAPTGRVKLTGKVLKADWRENQWGMQLKLTVLADDGYRVWTSAGKALERAEAGDRIEVTVTLKPSDDDETFAFGSRPSGGRVLKEER